MCDQPVSEYLFALVEEMKPAVHGGRFVSGEEFSALVRRLSTAIALAENIEEDKRFLERRIRIVGQLPKLVVVGTNVVPFRSPPTSPGAGQ
jgi:hypothetical protein